jgi:phosphatidylglycerol:prolipoprotein diacylglycerol transferase
LTLAAPVARNAATPEHPMPLPAVSLPLAIAFPDIDPVLVTIPFVDLPIRWYALAYIAGLVLGALYVGRLMATRRLWPRDTPPMAPGQTESLLTWMVAGIILGGRLGFVLFYQADYYLANPWEILRIWQGGMSFHGGFLGVVTATILFSRVNRVPVISLGDAVAAAAPMGIFFGRLANFINAELWGRPTSLPWGVIFPGPAAQICPEGWTGICARHPSQLYEAALEGLILFVVISWAIWRRGWLKHPGRVIGLFLLGYGLARTVVEGFRQADGQFITPGNPFGHILRLGTGPDAFGLTMGQILSLPMVALGLWILLRRRPARR